MYDYVPEEPRPHHKTTSFDRFFSFFVLIGGLGTLLSLFDIRVLPKFMPSLCWLWLPWWFILGLSSVYYPLWMKHLRWPCPGPFRATVLWICLSSCVGFGVVWALYVWQESPTKVFCLLIVNAFFSFLVGSMLDKRDKKKWMEICLKKGQKLPWEHWAWDWAERQRKSLVQYIAQNNVTSLSSTTQVVLSLLHFDHVDKDGNVIWNEGEGWRGVVEWARHEQIEANISGHNRKEDRLLLIAGEIAKKYTPVT
eukprot:TRINITY_DN12228_c0_g1_i2.p1 TRINITY_DN12228_c0_g1~~TRINITY_DN12228_c0_g1_i2.p1  ORF type:complete len:252 (-),score=32.01 TRINITY_DN12228_c0_g1_i2:116-871(-)